MNLVNASMDTYKVNSKEILNNYMYKLTNSFFSFNFSVQTILDQFIKEKNKTQYSRFLEWKPNMAVSSGAVDSNCYLEFLFIS